MPRKFCPLSFFSFYVNKENAQAGGAHHCVEEQCALWDETYEQCGLKSGVEALGSIAETGYSPRSRGKNLASAVSGNVTSVFDKLRKKKLPTVGNDTTNTSDTTNATSAASTKTTSAASTKNENQPLVAVGAQTEQNNKQSQQEKKPQNNQIKLPITPKLDGITSPFSEKQTQQNQQQKQQQTQQQQTQQTQQTQQNQQQNQPTQQTQQPQQESKKEDYSDLLNPPAVPVSELPIISKTDESKATETEPQKNKPIEAAQPSQITQPDSPSQTQPTTNQPMTQQQPSPQQQSEQTQAEPKKEENK